MSLLKKHWLILSILLIAGVLRFTHVSVPDVVTDEAVYGFRSIGYLDYLASDKQTTPVDWFGVDNLPAWTHLSFHDHPPVVFLVQHIFFKIFGVSIFILRFPFILAGIASVWLLYCIGKELFSKNVGLLAAGLLAVDPYHVWASRIGYLESVTIFFMLLSVYFFVRMLQRKKHASTLWGAATGLAVLSKYTAFFLLPVYATYIGWKKRDCIRNKKLYNGLILFGVLLLPVVIYNIALYRYTGHFDLQFASLFRQATPEWSSISRSAGFSLTGVFTMLFHLNGYVYGTLAYVSMIVLGWIYYKTKNASYILLILILGWIFVEFIIIGAGERFLSVFQPWIALSIACSVLWCASQITMSNKIPAGIIGIVLITQGITAFNTHVLQTPVMAQSTMYRPLHEYQFGYNELNSVIETVIAEEHMEGTLTSSGARRAIIIYDSNIQYFARMWYIDRHITYEGVPFTSTDECAYYIAQEDGTLSYYLDQGYTTFYLIHALDNTLQVPSDVQSSTATQIVDALKEQGLEPFKTIEIEQNKPAFEIYKF